MYFLKAPIFLYPDPLLSVCESGPVFSPASARDVALQTGRGAKDQGCEFWNRGASATGLGSRAPTSFALLTIPTCLTPKIRDSGSLTTNLNGLGQGGSCLA